MAINAYAGWTEDELLEALKAAQLEYSTGKLILSSGAGGQSVSQVPICSLEQRIRDLSRALNLLDPETYPDPGRPIKRVRVSFS